jgi:hypothetical protein
MSAQNASALRRTSSCPSSASRGTPPPPPCLTSSYRLLLEDLQKSLAPASADLPRVQEALKQIVEIAEGVNENVRRRENRDKLRQLHRLYGANVEVFKPERKFVREGEILKKCRKKDKRYNFYLFSDLLIYAEGQTYHRHFDLTKDNVVIQDVPDGGAIWIFRTF